MAKILGKNVTVSQGGTAIANKREASFTLNNPTIDVSDSDSEGYIQRMFDGLESLSSDISGLLTTENVASVMGLNGSSVTLSFNINDVYSISCTACATEISVNTTHNDAVSFSGTFESTGEITKTDTSS